METRLNLNDIASWGYVNDVEYIHDIEIEDSHNYYLEDQILVHNSGKTYTILFILALTALKRQKNINPTIISVVSESMPHLKRGAMRDFLAILKGEGLYNEKNHNKSDHIYTIGSVIIEFFSADNESKMRGSGRDILFMNECNNVKYAAAKQAMQRTKEKIYLDYNPVAEFWVHNKVMPFFKHTYIHSTYKDNIDHLPESQVEEIEQGKNIDKNWWRIYGEGLVGVPQNVVFPDWNIVDEFPANAKKVAYGLDLGYTNDPSALIKGGFYNGEVYYHEVFYEKGLAPIINPRKKRKSVEEYLILNGVEKFKPIYCDPSAPLYIKELRNVGYNTQKSDSHKIRDGIEIVKKHKFNVTKDSLNLIKELRNYTWLEKKDGEDNLEQEPIDDWNHGIDSLRMYTYMTFGVKHAIPYELAASGAM